MSEITSAKETTVAVLDGLAKEARTYSESIVINIFQLGRVYAEAKPLVPHGEWGAWLRENSGVSERTAQQFMQVYSRFGNKPAFSHIEKTKLFKMLSLPEGTEDDFIAEHDLSSMASRQVGEEVKRIREEADAEIERERAARRDAERRAEEAENRPAAMPDEVLQELQRGKEAIRERDEAIAQVREAAAANMEELRRLTGENSALRREIQDRDDMMREQQEEFDRNQAELLNLQSQMARGDAEKSPADELTAEAFAAAVRQFIGTCARMPYMAATFAAMSQSIKAQYDELLSTVEGWAKGARKALNGGATIEIE